MEHKFQYILELSLDSTKQQVTTYDIAHTSFEKKDTYYYFHNHKHVWMKHMELWKWSPERGQLCYLFLWCLAEERGQYFSLAVRLYCKVSLKWFEQIPVKQQGNITHFYFTYPQGQV